MSKGSLSRPLQRKGERTQLVAVEQVREVSLGVKPSLKNE